MTRPVDIAIVEDHAALRRGLELLLERAGCRVTGVAGNVAEGEDIAIRLRPDVTILDVRLPDGSGAGLARRLLATDPSLGLLMYTGSQDADVLADAATCGARGFALKSGPPEQLVRAIHAVAAGGTYVDPGVRTLLLARQTTERFGILTAREREILDLLARGLTGEGIAERLVISPETVQTHVRNARTKLEASTRAHAVAIALRSGEIPL